jgi:uncharacterized protein YdhG (YjbR/CyaY superfamily)
MSMQAAAAMTLPRRPLGVPCAVGYGVRMAEARRGRDRSRGEGFSDEERAAMRERAAEVKSARRGARSTGDGERDVLAKIGEMPEPDRSMAERLHAVVTAAAPQLSPRTWYGMPAYAKDGKVLCFFQAGSKFKTRYATFGFSDRANLDEGSSWPTAFALKELTPEVEARIAALVKRAVA